MVFELVGELLNIVGRQIERGNTRAAAVGACVAGLAGGVWTYHAGAGRPWDGGWIALAVMAGVAAGMAGGLVGSFVRPRAAADVEPWNAGEAAVVRATNYSRALAPTILCGLAWAAAVAGGVALATDAVRGGREMLSDAAGDPRALAIPAFLALLTVASLQAVFRADLGREIVVRRLFSSATFRPDELADWRLLPSDSAESVWLELRLGRRRPICVAVRRADLPKAEVILRRLSTARPAGAAAGSGVAGTPAGGGARPGTRPSPSLSTAPFRGETGRAPTRP